MMRNVLIAATALALAGCGSSSAGDDASVKAGSGEITNPGGKPRNDQEAQQASDMQKTGNAMNDQRAKDAAAMKAAMEKTGGK